MRGDKSKYTAKQKRQAKHIADGYKSRGISKEEAEARAWATVNKETGGGNLSGSGRGHPGNHESSRRGGRIGGSSMTPAQRSCQKGLENAPGPGALIPQSTLTEMRLCDSPLCS